MPKYYEATYTTVLSLECVRPSMSATNLVLLLHAMLPYLTSYLVHHDGITKFVV